MKVSYKKLWVMLAEREMSKVELRKLAGIAPATFTKLRRNQEVALSVPVSYTHLTLPTILLV